MLFLGNWEGMPRGGSWGVDVCVLCYIMMIDALICNFNRGGLACTLLPIYIRFFCHAVCNSFSHYFIFIPTGQTTSFFTAGYPAVAPNSTHALFLPLKPESQISSTSQASFVSGVFNNTSSWVKLLAESNGLSQEIQNALVSSTHALGKQSMTHAVDIHSYNQAILSKIDGIQHMVFVRIVLLPCVVFY